MLRRTFAYLLLGMLALEMLGHAARDRTLATTLLLYLPVLPVALAALSWDGMRRGHALPLRWLLSSCALVSAAIAVLGMWQPARSAEVGATQHRLRLVQWNTMWGGGNRSTLTHMLDAVAAQQPDLFCLSEAPFGARLQRSWDALHPGWHRASVATPPTATYQYNLAVMARFPVQLRLEWPLHTGHAALFELALPQRALRVLMVDLQSAPLLPRSPSIRQVAAVLEDRARAGQRVDLVLGDFNTPARFLGFDTLGRAAGGYRRASLWSGQWRGTWPSVLFFPMFDIDHVFVSTHLGVLGSAFFRGPGSDHRGQRADLRIP